VLCGQTLICTAITLALKSKSEGKRKLRSKWAKDWLLKRNNLSHIYLPKELKLEPSDWYSNLRMDSEAYLELLQKVTPRIRKCDSVTRRAITPHERLRYLATGRSYEDLKLSAAISPQALGVIIPETCAADEREESVVKQHNLFRKKYSNSEATYFGL